ncbi:hypothetical protein [Micromonospora sp. NPDC005299]|uniref:hypothetical protein n=1 Tax=Micromonospora sp. NPDC005299 TaxID=3364231 RepID=UPI0036CF752E
MTIAEKITLGVAIAGALGLGALLQVWFTHLLQRRERQISIADKSIQIAGTLMTKLEAELTRAQEALVKAQQESAELRDELAKNVAARSEDSERIVELHQKLQDAHVMTARSAIDNLQRTVVRLKHAGLPEEMAVALAQGAVAMTASVAQTVDAQHNALGPAQHSALRKVRLGRTEVG